MKTSTPFFPGFASQLFGRSPRKIADVLKKQAAEIQQASLGQLVILFGKFIPPELLDPDDSGTGSRQRIFSVRTTFWAFLAQVINPEASCREALRRIQAWRAAHGLSLPDSNTASYCEARSRLSLNRLVQIHQRVAHEVHRQALQAKTWFGREIKVVDGTTFSMPDTPDNQEIWPQSSGQKPGCGFPMAKVVGLFHLSSGVLLDWAEGNKHDHENKLFKSLLNHINPGDILLGDRAFCSFANLAELLKKNVDSLMRIHQRRPVDFRKGKKLGHRDRLIVWTRPAQRTPGWTRAQWKQLPKTLSLRMIEVQEQQPAFRVHSYVLITTLIDPKEYPAEQLAQLYFHRWNVELFFRDIKTSMGMDVLRCKSPEMIRRELILNAVAYNCIRGIMQHVAIQYDEPIERISFMGTLSTLRVWAESLNLHEGKPRKQADLVDAMLAVIADDLVPHRPDRSEPRAKKRRPKGYQLLTKPRHEMVVSSSRRNR